MSSSFDPRTSFISGVNTPTPNPRTSSLGSQAQQSATNAQLVTVVEWNDLIKDKPLLDSITESNQFNITVEDEIPDMVPNLDDRPVSNV